MYLARTVLLWSSVLAYAKRLNLKPVAEVVEEALTEDHIESCPDFVAAALMEEEAWTSGIEAARMSDIGDYTDFPGASENAKMFVKPFEELAFGTTSDRKKEWRTYTDYNGNGHVSLAELDAYILKKLEKLPEYKGKSLLLWKAFRPSYIRAFMDAKDVGENKKIKGTRSLQTDDYIQFNEFRVTLHYICLYALMYDKFAQVDGYGYGGEVGKFKGGKPPSLTAEEYDDRRIDPDEWQAGYEKVSDSGFVGLQEISDPDAVFSDIDRDAGGFILLKEWCEYLERKEAAAKTKFGKLLTLGE